MTRPCFVCQQPGVVHLIGMVYACHDHAEGVGGHYMEGSIDD